MTDGEWVNHDGRGMPVLSEAVVDVRRRNGALEVGIPAGCTCVNIITGESLPYAPGVPTNWDWLNGPFDIVAYRADCRGRE